MFKIICVLCLALAFSANAADVNLVKITNQEDATVSVMFLEVDENKNITAFGKKRYVNGVQSVRVVFPGNLTYAGIVLRRVKNKDLLILKSLNLDDRNGGSLEIDFLYNGITGKRKNFVVELGRTSDSWQLSKDGRIINHLELISNKVMILGTVGIKKIIVKK
jgi:hypothetical protein